MEFLLRVRPLAEGGYSASCRQVSAVSHPEVRAALSQVVDAEGATEIAALIAALVSATLPVVPSTQSAPAATGGHNGD